MNSKSISPAVIKFIQNRYTFSVLIPLIIILCFSPLFNADFVLFDDDILLTNNTFVKNIDEELFINSFSFNNIIHYHPLVYISFAFENFLFGMKPFFFHLVNILLHVANTFLVLILIRRVTGNETISLIAAVLFAVHPLHVESVAWIAERKDLLYTMFYLFSLVVYIKFVKTQNRRYYYISLLLFVLSCLSKAMAVTLPLVLILIDYILKENIKKNLSLKIPYLLISAVFIFINLNVAYYNYDVMVFNAYERIILIFYSLLFYPFKMLFPLNQSVIYPYPDSYTFLLYIIPFAGLALFCFVFRIKDEGKIIRFGLLFYVISILPVLPILPFGVSVVADRFAYLPVIGLFLIVLKLLEILWKKFRLSIFIPAHSRVVLIPVIVLLMAVISFKRCFVWKDTGTLMTDVIEKDGESYHAYYILGSYYYEKSDWMKSASVYSIAARLRPGFACTFYNLGNVFIKAGKYFEAIENYNIALKLNPMDKEAYNNLGLAYEYLGDSDNALKYYSLSAGLGYTPAKEVLLKLKNK